MPYLCCCQVSLCFSRGSVFIRFTIVWEVGKRSAERFVEVCLAWMGRIRETE